MKRSILPVLGISLVLVACSNSGGVSDTTEAATATTGLPTTTVAVSPDKIAAAEFAADVDRIESLFNGYSQMWFVSLEAATTHISDNVYPALGCTPKSALATFGGVEGQRESIVVLTDTIERADGWVMPIGPTTGEPITGRIYVFITETTVSVPGLDDVVTKDEAHATVVGDEALFFFQCWNASADG
jgi:hypothetical protein